MRAIPLLFLLLLTSEASAVNCSQQTKATCKAPACTWDPTSMTCVALFNSQIVPLATGDALKIITGDPSVLDKALSDPALQQLLQGKFTSKSQLGDQYIYEIPSSSKSELEAIQKKLNGIATEQGLKIQ